MALQKFCLALSLFSGCVLANTHECSPEEAVTCDSGGKASLDTRALYEQYHNDECDWTIKNKDGTVIHELTPSTRINVHCTLREIHLSINCVIPKRVDKCICYKLNTNELQSYGATRNHIEGEVVVSLCVLWWTIWWWCWN
ncbi:hypothetical protein Q7C36_007025 [Tachysurus vachellii]|uniref:Uncharacterized protein n=1 Tax=Tachysurus vachellii TaxID=175792 RepID=A0AA88T602_TACVA|nr:hypothetical protein Q7C36_007025 [Tachysurus vachellii]